MRLLLPLLLAACAADLGDTHEWDDGDGPFDTGTGEPLGVVTVDHEDGWSTTVDAMDGVTWQAVDLDAGGVAAEDTGATWDLKFQRFEIAVNGGVTGDGGVEAVFFDGLTLADVTAVPTDGWATDLEDGPDDNDVPDYVFRPWFDYDGETHVVSAREAAFVVRSTEQRHYAVALQSYYDDAGSSAVITFHWKALD